MVHPPHNGLFWTLLSLTLPVIFGLLSDPSGDTVLESTELPNHNLQQQKGNSPELLIKAPGPILTRFDRV